MEKNATVPKSIRKILEREDKSIPLTHKTCFGAGSSIKNSGFKFVLCIKKVYCHQRHLDGFQWKVKLVLGVTKYILIKDILLFVFVCLFDGV